MKVYFINHGTYNSGDTLNAWKNVVALTKQISSITKVTFLLNSTQQVTFLEEIGVKNANSASFNLQNNLGLQIQVRTLKTYHPDYLSYGNKPCEILVAICLSPEQLYQFEDKSDVAACVVVPWILNEWDGFFSIYQAEDVETGVKCSSPVSVPDQVQNAITWLKRTSFPNQGYNHPNDLNRLKQISKALKQKKIPMTYESVVYACMHNGYKPSAARKTADYFVGIRSIRLSEPFDKAWMNKVIEGKI